MTEYETKWFVDGKFSSSHWWEILSYNHLFSPIPPSSSKSWLWEGDDMQDVGSVQLWDLRRPLLLLSWPMLLHSSEGLWRNHPGQHCCPGLFKPMSRRKIQIKLFPQCLGSLPASIDYDEGRGKCLDWEASISPNLSPVWLLQGSFLASGKDLL